MVFLSYSSDFTFLTKYRRKEVNSISHFPTNNFVRIIICLLEFIQKPLWLGRRKNPITSRYVLFSYVGVEVTIR